MNTFGNNFKKANWKSLKDADAEWNSMCNAIASHKATYGVGGIDDYTNVDTVFNRVEKDPGPPIITDANEACIVMQISFWMRLWLPTI
jgi:hypothetical protein